MSSSIYLLDANIFIQAKNFHYRFDFCQVFWDWIIQAHHAGLVYSIDKVKNELNQYKGKANDPICQWMGDSALKNFFLPDLSDAGVRASYAKIMQWISGNSHYTQQAKNEFMQPDVADAFIIAVAMTYGHVIVTHEKSNPDAKKRVLIPDAAKEFGVDCIMIYDLLSRHAERSFTLKI